MISVHFVQTFSAQTDFQRPEQTSGSSAAAAPSPATIHLPQASSGRGRRRRASSPPGHIVPEEVLPALGPLKRYASMDCSTYESAVTTAKQMYENMLALEGGPVSARVRQYPSRARSQVSNSYLDFENIRAAALAGDFNLIRIGYYRNAALRTAMAENHGSAVRCRTSSRLAIERSADKGRSRTWPARQLWP